MSQTLAAAPQRRPSGAAVGTPRPTPATGRGARPPRPTLRVVRPPVVERGRTVFVVGCLMLLVTGLLSLLLINTALAQGSFTLHDLQAQSDELGDRQQALRQDIDVQAAPARLAWRARRLGMVPSQSPAFLRLSDGRLLGVATTAQAPAAPTVSGGASAQSQQGQQATASATPKKAKPQKSAKAKKPKTQKSDPQTKSR